MDARLNAWVLAGLLGGAALGLGACGKPEPPRQEEGTGGAGAAGAEQAEPQQRRGPGGSGEVVGTGVPATGAPEGPPVYGGPGRSDYTGPEPYVLPPYPTAPPQEPAPREGAHGGGGAPEGGPQHE